MQPIGTLGGTPNQFQQPFQPITQQYIPPKPYDEIVTDLTQIAKKNSSTSQLVSSLSTQARFPLILESLFWNKYAKLRKKSWGGCVCDQTLLINNQRMPIIRKPNYSDSTWNVSLDSIPITIGNQTADTFMAQKQTVSLREYLTNFTQYISSPEMTDSKDTDDDDSKQAASATIKPMKLLSDKSEMDNTVIMNTQTCILPINQSVGRTEFTIGTLNWKAGLKNPACLYIVSTINGTSAVVIEGNFQKIYYNLNGKNSPFVVTNEELMQDQNQCITIVQVPLRQKSRKQIEQEQAANSSWGLTNWWSGNTDQKKRVFDTLPTNCKDPKVQQLLKDLGYLEQCEDEEENNGKPKISRSGIKVIPGTQPTYCCTRPLKKDEAQTCYGEKNSNITVSCDGCGGSYSGEDIIWHCPETISDLHPNGYDLCDKCAQRQVKFDELRGLKGLKRDERYSIRVTLLYYKPTINGVIDEQIISDITQKLIKSETLGRVATPQQQPQAPAVPQQQPSLSPQQPQQIQPAVVPVYNPIPSAQPIAPPTPTKPMVNIPKERINEADYRMIGEALKELKLSGEYLKIFKHENVKDSDLVLLKDDDLNVLFPTLGPRVRFRAWLNENSGKLKGGIVNIQNAQNQSQYSQIGNIFRSLNVGNAQKYMLNFINYKITDKMLMDLIQNESDLKVLIPEMSVRVLFKGYLLQKQQMAARPVPVPQQQPPSYPMTNSMQIPQQHQQSRPAAQTFLF